MTSVGETNAIVPTVSGVRGLRERINSCLIRTIPGPKVTVLPIRGQFYKDAPCLTSNVECQCVLHNRVAGGIPPSPHTTRRAGSHRAVHQVYRAVAGL